MPHPGAPAFALMITRTSPPCWPWACRGRPR